MSEERAQKIEHGLLIGLSIFTVISIVIGIAGFNYLMPSEYTSFGEKEIEIINKQLGITIDGSTTPIKLTVKHALVDYFCEFELLLKDIDDPQKFLENCFDGTWSGAWTLTEVEDPDFEKWRPSSQSNIKKWTEYNCEIADGYKKFDKYTIVIYKYEQGKSYYAKIKAVR